MATPMTHGLVGMWAAQFAPASVPRFKLAIWSGALAVLPDLDIAAFYLGIRYSDMLGHRGLSHSATFALLTALVVSGFLVWKFRLGIKDSVLMLVLASFATLSHGFLDMATNGGLGVGLFLPFSEERYFFPLRPIVVSPINPAVFVNNAALVLLSEAKWVWVPLLAVSALFHSGQSVLGVVRCKRF